MKSIQNIWCKLAKSSIHWMMLCTYFHSMQRNEGLRFEGEMVRKGSGRSSRFFQREGPKTKGDRRQSTKKSDKYKKYVQVTSYSPQKRR